MTRRTKTYFPWMALAGVALCSSLTLRFGNSSAADETDESTAGTKKDETPAAIEIPASDFRLTGSLPGRLSDKPQVIKSAAEFTDFIKTGKVLALTDDADLDAINTQINFENRELLVFAWSGSGRDQFKLVRRDGEVEAITLYYQPGLTRDLRGHLKLFAVKKGVAWKVSGGR